nr:hypothetical protein CFP56_59499 [Quercus suber]
MADELERLWSKLSFTEEEDEGIKLDFNCTRVAREIRKNCVLMKILAHKSISTEALRKNMRMLWKPNKGVQISEVVGYTPRVRWKTYLEGDRDQRGSYHEAAPSSLITILAWNCRGMRSTLAIRTFANEMRSKDPLLFFLTETKTGKSKMKGIRNKVEYTQGITVPSDGRSGGLAMMWKEG